MARSSRPAPRRTGMVDRLEDFVRDVVHGAVTRVAVVAAVLVLAVVAVVALAVVLVAG